MVCFMLYDNRVLGDETFFMGENVFKINHLYTSSSDEHYIDNTAVSTKKL